VRASASVLLIISLTGGCFLDHEVEPYYGHAVAPRAQELRWSDGGLPQIFDPAFAAAPPDTDAVRALFEGLTDYDPQTLKPVAAIATRWESADEGREWTFYLRHDARWSSGDAVTARDFVRSWQRAVQMGQRTPHARLLENLVGAQVAVAAPSPSPSPRAAEQAEQGEKRESKAEVMKETKEAKKEEKAATETQAAFGAEALDDYTLRVRLREPDKDFPALVAHPAFRPVHDSSTPAGDVPSPDGAPNRPFVSNGAFQLSKAGRDMVVLERSGSYWDAQAVKLQRVQFVAARDSEAALAAYRAGEVDAVTNAAFEPLALKLLAPYKDLQSSTFGALTYYGFNTAHKPFDDARVREALAVSIDRERISREELGDAAAPALKFLPDGISQQAGASLKHDVVRAQNLLAGAGYPQGKGFPRVRLLVNRNEQQRQVAQSVAAMWRSALGVETEVIVKSWDEYEAAVRAGDYDVVRRGLVLPTTDEASNLRLMFEQDGGEAIEGTTSKAEVSPKPEQNAATDKKQEAEKQAVAKTPPRPVVLTEARALEELPAIPIYFPSTYALVKPYVSGFDTNVLDAPSLKRVQIDTGWKAPKQTVSIW
jgi:ABC-type oligopeptide transport system substrate-binding subunit